VHVSILVVTFSVIIASVLATTLPAVARDKINTPINRHEIPVYPASAPMDSRCNSDGTRPPLPSIISAPDNPMEDIGHHRLHLMTAANPLTLLAPDILIMAILIMAHLIAIKYPTYHLQTTMMRRATPPKSWKLKIKN
jgi:hypothetical protein